MQSVSRILLSSLCVVAFAAAGGGAVVASGRADVLFGAWNAAVARSRGTPEAPVPQAGSWPTNAAPGQFTTEDFSDPSGQHMTYYLYVPAHYSAAKQYPLVLLLHGSGERSQSSATAAQNRSVLLSQQYVQDWIAPDVQTSWPSFVLVPQVAGSNRWVNVASSNGSYTLLRQPSTSLVMAMDIVTTLQDAFPSIDSNRMYITGLSMGGFGVYDAIERWTWLFAAAVPLAGGGDPSRANLLADLPLWDFHGSADTAAPVSASRQMIAAISNAGGTPCYTEYPGDDHGIWNSERVYANASLLTWLFSQSKASTTDGLHPLSCPQS